MDIAMKECVVVSGYRTDLVQATCWFPLSASNSCFIIRRNPQFDRLKCSLISACSDADNKTLVLHVLQDIGNAIAYTVDIGPFSPLVSIILSIVSLHQVIHAIDIIVAHPIAMTFLAPRPSPNFQCQVHSGGSFAYWWSTHRICVRR